MRILIMLFISLTLFAAEIHWAGSYNEAQMLSKKTGKPVYLFISAPECPWCEKFENTTLKKKEIIQLLNDRFVPVHLVRGFDTIPTRFKVRPVPRHYVFDDAKKYFYEDIGYFPEEIFLLMLNTTLKEMKE